MTQPRFVWRLFTVSFLGDRFVYRVGYGIVDGNGKEYYPGWMPYSEFHAAIQVYSSCKNGISEVTQASGGNTFEDAVIDRNGDEQYPGNVPFVCDRADE